MEKSDSKEFISNYEAQKMLGMTTPINPSDDWYAADPNRRKRILKIMRRDARDDPETGDVIWEPQEAEVGPAGDDHTLAGLILNFSLIPYREESDQRDPDQTGYKIAHDVYEDPDPPVEFWVNSLVFKMAEAEALKSLIDRGAAEPEALEHQIKRLEMQRDNILRLQQSRNREYLGPSKLLRDALAEVKKQIADFSQLERSATKKLSGPKHITQSQAGLKKLLPRWKDEVKRLLQRDSDTTIAGAYRTLCGKGMMKDPYDDQDYTLRTFRRNVKDFFPPEKRKGGRPRIR